MNPFAALPGDVTVVRESQLAASVGAEGIHFEGVDDYFARAIRQNTWPRAVRVTLNEVTCSGLSEVLLRFPVADFVTIRGLVSSIQGQLGPLAKTRAVSFELAGNRLWSESLEKSLLSLPLVELGLDTTRAEPFVLSAPGLSTHRPDPADDAFELLRKVGHKLERLSLVTDKPLLARLETELGGLRHLSLHGSEHVVPRLRSLRSLTVHGLFNATGELESLETIRIRTQVSHEALGALGCSRVKEVIWEGDAAGLGFLLARYGKTVERLVVTLPTHGAELVRANPALPMLRELNATGDDALIAWLVENELLRLEVVDFFTHVADGPLASLIRRFGATLKSTLSQLGLASLEALLVLETPVFESARFSSQLDSRHLAQLARRPIAKTLRTLEWETPLTSADARLLADPAVFPSLTRLNANGSELTDGEREAVSRRLRG